MTKSLPYLYYPTTIVLIDDDARFLDNIILNMNLDLSFKTYQDPEAALKYLKTLKNQNHLLSHTLSQAEEHEEGKFSVDFNISNIYQEAYNQKQFAEVSLLFVDYAMPKMNGAALLECLDQCPAKRLMLTGQAEESQAVDLFNKGHLDKFILKTNNSLSLIQAIRASTQELVNKYFHDFTSVIAKALPGQLSSCLTDPVFIDHFHKILSAHAISSYYLIEASGSFLLLDNDAKPTWLLVKSKEEMLEFSKQAQTEGAPESVIAAIASGKKIPYFSNFDEYVKATKGHWEKSLYPAQELHGKKLYFYSLTDQVTNFPLKKNKILSFNEYLHTKKT